MLDGSAESETRAKVALSTLPTDKYRGELQLTLKYKADSVVKTQLVYPLSYRVPVREWYGSTLLPATREQHDQNCTQSH